MGILEKIEAAGVVGCGGAGFPTHRKLNGDIQCLIVNGAECEPLLRTDRYIMRNQAPQLVKAVSALAAELRIPRCVIALKDHYHEEMAALKQAIEEADAGIELHALESFYPAGDEVTLVYEVTGRVVPPGGIPIAVGAVVSNAATVYAISEAMDGIPFTQKYLTVTGEVRRPTILRVPIGTSFRTCLELAGGPLRDDFFLVAGGPMMGRPLPMSELETAVVTKTTSGILVLPADGPHARTNELSIPRVLNRARSVCIQCTFCTQLCPRHLLGHPLQPNRIMRRLAVSGPVRDLLNDPVIQSAQLCCECGVCELYACPMGLNPRRINSMIKKELAAAHIRRQGGEETPVPSPYREERKIPTQRAAARAGVLKYNDYEIKDLLTAQPDQVSIPLQMHIGPPAVPVVREGDHVEAGAPIARPKEGALGAVIHASISGRVQLVGEWIVIGKE